MLHSASLAQDGVAVTPRFVRSATMGGPIVLAFLSLPAELDFLTSKFMQKRDILSKRC